MPLPHHHDVILLEPDHGHVVLAHKGYQQLRQEMDKLVGFILETGSSQVLVVDAHPLGQQF